MKKIQQVAWSFITASLFLIYSCGPNDDKGGMDQENSNKEGAVDSTRIPKSDSAHSYKAVPGQINKRTNFAVNIKPNHSTPEL